MNTTPRKLIAVAAAILMASASAFAAVKNGASLKGTDYTKGGNNAKGGGVIAWNSFSSVDPTAFSHNLSSGDLTVLKDGDYLVAFTVPLTTINSQRNTHRAELLVNGDAVSTAVGESSYIRFASNHSEASDHFAGLVGLKANDVLTVKTTPTAQTGGNSFIATCSLYAELVEGDRNVFSATATEIQSGVELNVEPDIGDQGLVWTSTRKGSGYTHSDGEASITIKDAGNYMVYANVPLRGNVARASVGLTLNLDDEYIEGARGQQGYIRNANDHKDSSIHFSGMIRAEAGQVLTVTTEQLAKAGSIKVQADRAASIFIEKMRNDGLFSDQFTGTTAGEDLNPVNKTALALDGDSVSLSIIDNVTYSNDGDNEENIVIKKAGSYLLSFNSTFTGGSARANPRVTVEVNGSVVPGATSTAHYNRHADGHDETTGSFVALLSDLAVDDVVTVSVQREAAGGVVTSPEGGRVVLQAKATYEPAAGDQSPPRFSSFSGGLDGFSAVLVDSGLKLDAATLKATLNGEVVAVTVDSANGVNAISYAFPTFPSTGSEHALNIAFNDTGGNAHSMDFAFTVNIQYQTISPAFSMSDVNKDKGGFRVNLSQISAIQTEGPVQIHGNSWVNAEKQIRGEFLNPNEVDDDDNPLPYLNEADPDAWEGWSIAPADVDYVNMNQDEDGNIGNFGEDQTLPNIPGWGDSTDGIAGEFLTVLHLKKGFQTLGVNSDDGFRATIGINFLDMEAKQIGLFDGSRGSADSLFNIVAPEEGYYPLRVLWWEGGGGANIEIFSIVDGEKVLVNDPDNADAIKAYNIGNSTGRTYFGSVSPTPDDKFTTENSISATIIEGGTKAKSGSIKVLLNGEEVDASVNSADGVVTVTAEPDGGLGIGSHTATVVFTETTDPETERSFEWNFEVTAFSIKVRDLVDGEPNPIAYWDFDFADAPDLTFEHVFNLESDINDAKYTEDKGGHTGEAGDYAMDFLETPTNMFVQDGEVLDIATSINKISFSVWVKNHATSNATVFWANTSTDTPGTDGLLPPFDGRTRVASFHIPWGNENIYFDTAGCCDTTLHRIVLNNSGFSWDEWHHYAFVMDEGHKSIWIDGELFHEGDNTLPLPHNSDIFSVGSRPDLTAPFKGIVDDLAIFASALTEEQIIALAEGNTDILPEKREIEVPLPDIPILLSKSPTGAAAEGEETEISLRFRGIDFTDLSITVNDKAVDPTITVEGSFTTITANGAFSLGKNVIALSWNGESETWNYYQFSVAEGQTGLASYSVETVGAVPGPWAFEDGVWVSDGSVAGCGGPYHDFLTSPDYTVSADGEVTLSFEHRHAFEGAMWDSGQLWISVNGGAYADVGKDAFSENGYTDVAIIGNGIAKGQNGFGNTSAGYADGSYITTTANLGSFAAGDAISVRFVALYDDCSTGVNPNWVVASVSSDQMAIVGDAPAPALATDKASYMSGEDITVNFSNGLGNPKDWVGIYKPDGVPGDVGSTKWSYVSGTTTAGEGLTDGTITFAGGLPAGSYVARFFENDGYTQIADAVAFTVIDPPGVSTSKAKYGPGESITINFSDGPGNPKDWVGLYRPDMTPGDVGSLVWAYVGGTQTAGDGLTEGSVTFANGMAVGDYKAIYFENDGYAQLASTTFSVAAAELPEGVLFAEDFDGLALGPWVSDSESGGDGTDWTATAPTGWVMATGDGHGATAGGDTVTEFDGWTFVDPVTWNATAGQERSQFTKGSGAIAVADSDEFDDKADAGFNASLSTPAIDISSAAAGTLVVTYDSSWRQEPQNGKVTVAFDGGAAVTLLELTPDTPTAYNETVSLNLNNPAGAQTAVISWEKQGHNNWWWAIDNIIVAVKVDGLSSAVAGLSTQALDSLVAHYDGKNGVKTDGASVVSWTPIGANGDSLDDMIVRSTQRGGAGQELITYDGSGKLTFDDTSVGADGRYLEGVLSNAESKELTVFWVGNYSAEAPFATSGAYVYNIGINNTSHQRDDGAGGFVVEQYNGTTYAGDDITAHDGVTTVWSTVLTADSHAFYANGENLNVAGTPSNNIQANASMIIGAYSSSGYDFVGEVEQLIIFGSALSDADRELVEGYLGATDTPATPALSIVNNGDGSVTVTFEGKLQGASTVNGPWADVEGAVSPQIIPAGEAMQFGRAVK